MFTFILDKRQVSKVSSPAELSHVEINIYGKGYSSSSLFAFLYPEVCFIMSNQVTKRHCQLKAKSVKPRSHTGVVQSFLNRYLKDKNHSSLLCKFQISLR